MRFSEWITAQLDALRAMVGSDDDDAKTAPVTSMHPAVQETRSADKLQLKFRSDTAHLSHVRRSIEHFCADAGLDACAREEVGLVVNEAIANIIRHAYGGEKDQPIQATVERYPDGVKISLRDWGSGIDPTLLARPAHDPLVPGGLGLICIKRLMDEVSYQPQKDGMLLVMTRTTRATKSCPDDKAEFA